MKVLVSTFTAPSAPPHSIMTNPTSPQILTVSWQPPPTVSRNGIIRRYIIRLLEEETMSNTRINTQTNTTTFTIDGLHPHYHYNVSVAARTVDIGPFSFHVQIQMPERG